MDKIGIAVCDDEKAIHDEVDSFLKKYENKYAYNYEIHHCYLAKELFEISPKIQIVLEDKLQDDCFIR